MTPAEIQLFDFLTTVIGSAAQGDPLFNAELHDTVYQKITADRGIRISEATGEFSLGPGGVANEYDVTIIIVCYARVTGVKKQERQPALADVFDLVKRVFEVLMNDPTLGGRVCDLIVQPGGRGYDTFDGEPFAVANMPIVINPRSLG